MEWSWFRLAVKDFKSGSPQDLRNSAFHFLSRPSASGLIPGNFDFLRADFFRELKLSQPLHHPRGPQSYVRCHIATFRSLLWRTIRHSQRMGGQIESVRGQIVSGQKNPAKVSLAG